MLDSTSQISRRFHHFFVLFCRVHQPKKRFSYVLEIRTCFRWLGWMSCSHPLPLKNLRDGASHVTLTYLAARVFASLDERSFRANTRLELLLFLFFFFSSPRKSLTCFDCQVFEKTTSSKKFKIFFILSLVKWISNAPCVYFVWLLHRLFL